jgi:hypothetical protein
MTTPKTQHQDNPFENLEAVPAVSLLGNHDGVADDLILELLEEAADHPETD